MTSSKIISPLDLPDRITSSASAKEHKELTTGQVTEKVSSDLDQLLSKLRNNKKAKEASTDSDDGTRVVTDTNGTSITFTKMSHIQPQPMEMLWEGRIPLGAITIIAGDPKVGKSFLTVTIAARVSAGLSWPDVEGKIPKGSVILVTCEDNLKRKVWDHLDAAGANLDNIEVITDLKFANGKRGWFNLNEHLSTFEKGIREDTQAIIIDPMSAFVGGSGLSSNTKTRALMGPIAKLAERYNVAVILITHLTKSKNRNFLYRVIDSIGQVATARMIYGVIKDQSMKSRRLFLPVAGNLSDDRDATGLAFRIIDGAVEFEPDVIEDPEQCLQSEVLAADRPTPKLDAAKTFLQEKLADGPVKSEEILKMALGAGITDDTLRRAQSELGINPYSVRNSEHDCCFWALPEENNGN